MWMEAQWDARCYGNKEEHKQHETLWNKYQNAIGFVITTEPAVAKCKRLFGETDTNLRQADMIARGFPFRRDRDVALASFPLVLGPSGGECVCMRCVRECVRARVRISMRTHTRTRVCLYVACVHACMRVVCIY